MPSDINVPVAGSAPAGLLRRLGAILYDSLLAIAVLAVLLFFVVPFTGAALVPAEIGAWAYVAWAVEVLLIALFFGYFWTRRGQTVGMLAWRLRITRSDGSAMGWRDATRRLAVLGLLFLLPVIGDAVLKSWLEPQVRLILTWTLVAPLVASYLWIWVDRDRQAWHDRWSGTRMWVVPKRR